MALTDEEREQVVELLRCAADLYSRTHTPFGEAADSLGIQGRLRMIANDITCRGFGSVTPPATCEFYQYAYLEIDQYAYLEIAARVEEGSWP